MNILFVCSRNQWRSPTAEELYKNHPSIHAKSAGTSPSARIKINSKLVQWADIIFVMEKKHKQQILERFQNDLEDQHLVILDIPDDYKFMDPELIEDLQSKLNSYFNTSN